MGTHWEQQKFNTPTLPQNKEKLGSHGCMLPHLIGYKIFFFGLPMAFAIFGLG
jgi:hypothetical protein